MTTVVTDEVLQKNYLAEKENITKSSWVRNVILEKLEGIDING